MLKGTILLYLSTCKYCHDAGVKEKRQSGEERKGQGGEERKGQGEGERKGQCEGERKGQGEGGYPWRRLQSISLLLASRPMPFHFYFLGITILFYITNGRKKVKRKTFR